MHPLTWCGARAAKKTAFDSYEAEIFEELQALVADAGALHTFLEAALKLESSALTSAIGSQPTTIFDVSPPQEVTMHAVSMSDQQCSKQSTQQCTLAASRLGPLPVQRLHDSARVLSLLLQGRASPGHEVSASPLASRAVA